MTAFFRTIPALRSGFTRSLALWLSVGAMAVAQTPRATIVFGEIHSVGARLWSESILSLESAGGGRQESRIFLHPDGSFELRDVPPGAYQATLTDWRGEVVWRDLVTVGSGSSRLVIELDEQVRQKITPDTISVARLARKYPAAAVRELRLGARALQQNNLADSNTHLRRAIEIAPNMQDAHSNLGANYLHSGEYEEARRELQAAVDLDPESPIPQVNLTFALLYLNRIAEAEHHARHALRRDPLSARANFAMGAVLEREGKGTEALRYLERASKDEAQSLLIEARILIARSDAPGGISKLREYLSRPAVLQRQEAQRWLKLLTAAMADTREHP
jgi:tetratricopeptide (TPR) repeat protein